MESRRSLEKDIQDAVFNNDLEQTADCLKKLEKENIKQIINSTTSGNHTLLYRFVILIVSYQKLTSAILKRNTLAMQCPRQS